jgi:hypothetical protein
MIPISAGRRGTTGPLAFELRCFAGSVGGGGDDRKQVERKRDARRRFPSDESVRVSIARMGRLRA